MTSCHFGTCTRKQLLYIPDFSASPRHISRHSASSPTYRTATIPPRNSTPAFALVANCIILPHHHACIHDAPQSTKHAHAAAMITSGFTNAPVSQFLVFGTVIAALLASLTDTRYYVGILVAPHFWGYAQFWRALVWPICFTNSTEVLFGVLSLYNLRVVERLWGSRKFAVSPPPTSRHSSSRRTELMRMLAVLHPRNPPIYYSSPSAHTHVYTAPSLLWPH